MTAEIASLAAGDAAQPRKKRGFGKLLGAAVSMVPGVAVARSTALMSAATIVQTGLAQGGADLNPQATDATIAARRERLTSLFDKKRC